MPLRTTVAKALAQIERRDPNGAAQYRAELRYFHVPQRVVLGMTNAYEVVDEVHVWGPSGAEFAEGMRRALLNTRARRLGA